MTATTEAPKKIAGWVSPEYAVSRTVSLQQEQMLSNRCVAFFSGSREAETYRILRTQILQKSEVSGGKTIMVTSAHFGEGKTLTAVNLALTFAQEFSQTVLLVDCDLRQQGVHTMLGYSGTKGLADYLTDGTPLSDIIVWPGIEKLTIISGGKTLGGSSEILASPGMKSLVEEMRNRYTDRYVIFDMPPILDNADTLAFTPLVDHIIVVVEAGKTSASDINKALALLPRDKVLGLVLNRAQAVS